MHFVAYFHLWLIDVCSIHRRSCYLDVDIKQHRSNNQIFLNFVKLRCPQISLVVIMTACNKAQMNVILAVYLDSTMLLCWWHMLHVIWMHFCTEEFLELWEHI